MDTIVSVLLCAHADNWLFPYLKEDDSWRTKYSGKSKQVYSELVMQLSSYMFNYSWYNMSQQKDAFLKINYKTHAVGI